jgi:hypothetical protein
MPIITTLVMARLSPRAARAARRRHEAAIVGRTPPGKSPSRSRAIRIWPRISPAVRLRTSVCVPVWQNEQVSVQPTCEETQSVPRSASGI